MRHDGYTTESFIEGTCTAACTCGWTSPEYNTKEEAQSALILHYKDKEITAS